MVKFFVPSSYLGSGADADLQDQHYRLWLEEAGLSIPEEHSSRLYSIQWDLPGEHLTATVGQFISGTPDLVLAIASGGPGIIVFTDGGKVLRRPPVWGRRFMVHDNTLREFTHFD